MNNCIAEKVIDAITIPEVLRQYGYAERRGKRIPCPIHMGKNANFCYTDKVFHCWTCGAKGDVIQLVRQLFGVDFGQALLKINTDFGLGLTTKKPTYRERRELAENIRIQQAYERWKEQQHQRFLAYTSAYSVLFRQSQLQPENTRLATYVLRLEGILEQYIEEVKF